MNRNMYPMLRRCLAGIVPILALLAATAPIRAQIPPLDEYAAGRTYVVAFPDTTANGIDTALAPPVNDVISLFLYSAVDNHVQITGNGYSRAVDLVAGKVTVVTLNDSASRRDKLMVSEAGAISRNTFRVEGAEPLVLYCYIFTRFGSEAWTPIPVERWGMEYYAASHPGEIAVDMFKRDIYNYGRRHKAAPAEILVIAAYDHTTINIAANGRVDNYDSTRVTLNAGEAYLVKSWVDTTADSSGLPQPDWGGSKVTANRPIGVISGNTRAQLYADRNEVTDNSLKNLLIEWMAPSEQFGREFLSMPTWDTRRLTGEHGERVEEKRTAEYLRVYGATNNTKIYHLRDSSSFDTASVNASFVSEVRIQIPRPQYFRTDKPAQVMMASSAVVKYNGTISGVPGSQTFDSWGPYMVDVTPREQWTTCAPYFVPANPAATRHYINVVTDTNSLDKIYDENGAPIDFNMGVIKGTDLMWGTMPVMPGSHRLSAVEGAKFYAFQYGITPGLESYRPDVKGQTFAEYRELLGLSYGYPLAPERRIFRQPDELKIDKLEEPCRLNVKIKATNANPVGLLSAVLDNSSVNARIRVLNPVGWNDVAGVSQAELDVIPIDPLRDASGTLVITDRTGKATTVPYTYRGDSLALNPSRSMDFGELSSGGKRDSVVVITNTLNHDVAVKNVVLRFGSQAFTIVSTEPAAPATVPPGGTIRVTLRASPPIENSLYRDTLRVQLTCAELRVPLQIGPIPPCITVTDIDFGVVELNQPKTMTMRICNEGHGTVSFVNPAVGALVTWDGTIFRMEQKVLDTLKLVHLGANECINVPVIFRGTKEDTFAVVARIWASTRECRDTAIWRGIARKGVADVPEPGPGADIAGATFAAVIQPNPTNGITTIAYTLPSAASVKLSVFDMAGHEIATLVDAHLSAGPQSAVWDATGVASGSYFCRIVVDGAARTLPVIIRK